MRIQCHKKSSKKCSTLHKPHNTPAMFCQLTNSKAYKVWCHWDQLGLVFSVRVSFKVSLVGLYFIKLYLIDRATELFVPHYPHDRCDNTLSLCIHYSHDVRVHTTVMQDHSQNSCVHRENSVYAMSHTTVMWIEPTIFHCFLVSLFTLVHYSLNTFICKWMIGRCHLSFCSFGINGVLRWLLASILAYIRLSAWFSKSLTVFSCLKVVSCASSGVFWVIKLTHDT